jgi:hypothetical protein
VLRPPTHCARAALSAASPAGSGSSAVPVQPVGRSAGCSTIADSCGVGGGPVTAGELAAAGELTGADGAAELADAEGALLDTGALEIGAADNGADVDDEAEAAELDGAACELELLLHPTNTTDTDTAIATEDQTLE